MRLPNVSYHETPPGGASFWLPGARLEKSTRTKESGDASSATCTGEQDENVGRSDQHSINLSNSPVKESNATWNNGRCTNLTLNSTNASCTLGANTPPLLGSPNQDFEGADPYSGNRSISGDERTGSNQLRFRRDRGLAKTQLRENQKGTT